MNKENKKIEARFIPCGDSFEKMNAEMNEEVLETVSGGIAADGESGASAFPIRPHAQPPEFQDAIIQENSGGM